MIIILLVNVKMPKFFGILTFISMINRTSECLKAIAIFTFPVFSVYKQRKVHAQLS